VPNNGPQQRQRNEEEEHFDGRYVVIAPNPFGPNRSERRFMKKRLRLPPRGNTKPENGPSHTRGGTHK